MKASSFWSDLPILSQSSCSHCIKCWMGMFSSHKLGIETNRPFTVQCDNFGATQLPVKEICHTKMIYMAIDIPSISYRK